VHRTGDRRADGERHHGGLRVVEHAFAFRQGQEDLRRRAHGAVGVVLAAEQQQHAVPEKAHQLAFLGRHRSADPLQLALEAT
jgi:hypothetical protein